jgi:hypothetical protein
MELSVANDAFASCVNHFRWKFENGIMFGNLSLEWIMTSSWNQSAFTFSRCVLGRDTIGPPSPICKSASSTCNLGISTWHSNHRQDSIVQIWSWLDHARDHPSKHAKPILWLTRLILHEFDHCNPTIKKNWVETRWCPTSSCRRNHRETASVGWPSQPIQLQHVDSQACSSMLHCITI